MFVVVVSLRVRSGMTAEFLQAMGENATTSLRDEPGCLRFDILRDIADPDHFVLYEVYSDEDAFRQVHLTAPHFLAWKAASAAIVAESNELFVPEDRAAAAGSLSGRSRRHDRDARAGTTSPRSPCTHTGPAPPRE